MQAYPTEGPVNNLHAAPAVPVYRRTFEERRALSLQRCADAGPHKGRARRWRRETQTKQTLAWLARLAAGAPAVARGPGRAYSLRELLQGGGPERPQWVRAAQEEATRRAYLAEKHGPASGWGIAQPEAGAVGNPKWTPYYVPKAAEKGWRWWRAVCLALARVLGVLARWLGCVVPLHRQLLEQEPAGRNQSTSAAPAREATTGYRDHSATGWEAALERARRASGM